MRFARSLLLLAAVLFSHALAFAGASASVRVQMQISVTDLDPNDGIAPVPASQVWFFPTYTVGNRSQADPDAPGWGPALSRTAAFLEALEIGNCPEFNGCEPPGLARAGSFGTLYDYTYFAQAVDAGTGAFAWEFPPDFESERSIAPMSAMTFSGTFTVHARVDGCFDEWTCDRAEASFRASTGYMDSPEIDGGGGGIRLDGKNGPQSLTMTWPFSITTTNPAPYEAAFFVQFLPSTQALAAVATPVPEPSTWALLLLGLCALHRYPRWHRGPDCTGVRRGPM